MSSKFFTRFLLVWFINSLLLYLADTYGMAIFSLRITDIQPFWTSVYTGLFLTLACKLSGKFLEFAKIKIKGRFKMFLYYWFVNALFIWVIAVITHFVRLEAASIYWAIALGFVMDVMQWFMRQIFKSLNLMRS